MEVPWKSRLVNLDLDGPRLGEFLLGESDGEGAVLVVRLHLVGLDRVRQAEVAGERAEAALDAMVAAAALLRACSHRVPTFLVPLD